jgi:uncharacterized protein YndB with AHSA1/START domain
MENHAVKELTITRMLNAPRQLVLRTWIDPKHMAVWWGPKGFTNPVCQLDVRPGGAIRIDMTFPDGTAHPMTGVFNEIDEPHRLVFTCFAFFDETGKPQLEVINSIIFEEAGKQTKLTVHARVMKAVPGVKDAIAGMDEGWSQSLDRLVELLDNVQANETQNGQANKVMVEHIYNAPVPQVWNAITIKEQMKQWYFDVDAFKPEPGFEFTFIGKNEGRSFVHLCRITEVIPNKKIAYTWRYKDYEGSSLVTFELFAEGEKTRLKLTHTGIESFPDKPDFAKKNFVEGWTYLISKSLPEFLHK